jgi:hypothetical protein
MVAIELETEHRAAGADRHAFLYADLLPHERKATRDQTVPRHNLLRSESGNLESDLHGSWKREFSEAPIIDPDPC